MDLRNILENPFASSKDKVIFDPKKVYDFELEKTADEKVLLKQMKTALEQTTETKHRNQMFPIPTVPLVPFLVLRLQEDTKIALEDDTIRGKM